MSKRPQNPPDIYEVKMNPNTLAIALESALRSATKPLYEEIGLLQDEISQLRQQQQELVEELKRSRSQNAQ